MSQENFENFRLKVLREPELQLRLRDLADAYEFYSRVIDLGHENGFEFSRADVEAAMMQAREEALERWL